MNTTWYCQTPNCGWSYVDNPIAASWTSGCPRCFGRRFSTAPLDLPITVAPFNHPSDTAGQG